MARDAGDLVQISFVIQRRIRHDVAGGMLVMAGFPAFERPGEAMAGTLRRQAA
jgi:hypothetical protein